jgi:hypothetical protein
MKGRKDEVTARNEKQPMLRHLPEVEEEAVVKQLAAILAVSSISTIKVVEVEESRE